MRSATMHLELMPQSAGAAAVNDAASGDARLRELADGALRRAVAVMQPDGPVDAGVRELIRMTCNLAHDRGLRAEQLLVLIKAAWSGLPEGQRRPRHDDGDVLARVITVCIHEYYAKGAAE